MARVRLNLKKPIHHGFASKVGISLGPGQYRER